MRIVFALAIASTASAACTGIDRYGGLDGPPGGYVTGSSPVQRMMSELDPVKSQYKNQWVRIRVIAPAGATRCRIADQSLFMPLGPQAEGRPDSAGAVMLTYDAFSSTASFTCDTPDGRVKRSVNAVPYVLTLSGRYMNTVQVKPPMVHVDPSDADAEARWTSLAAELCPVVSERATAFACKPGMLEKLKAADIGVR